MANQLDKENLQQRQETSQKDVLGKMDSQKETGNKLTKMVMYIQEIFLLENLTVKEHYNVRIQINMQETGFKAKDMDKESILTHLQVDTKVNGKKIKGMELEFIT